MTVPEIEDAIEQAGVKPFRWGYSGTCIGKTLGAPVLVGSYDTVNSGWLSRYLASSLPPGSELEYEGRKYVVVCNVFRSGSPDWPGCHDFIIVPAEDREIVMAAIQRLRDRESAGVTA